MIVLSSLRFFKPSRNTSGNYSPSLPTLPIRRFRYYDCYLCENNQILRYRTTTRDGYREYVSDPRICETCPLLSQCTKSREHRKVILRHLWQEAMDEVEHLRHADANRALYRKRQETIERVFADAKEKHGMRWTRYRGVKKTMLQAMLTFIALNLEKLAN